MEFLDQIEGAKKLQDEAMCFDDVSRAKLLHAKDIVIDDRVRFQCSFSGCRNYGKKLMCPPNTPTVDEFRKIIDRYYMGLIVQVESDIIDKDNWEPEVAQFALRLHDIIYRLEKRAFAFGFPFAAGLIGGSCKLCKECAGDKDPNATCVNREKARPSLEAMGIDVITTCKRAGMEVVFSPGKVVLTGLVLIN